MLVKDLMSTRVSTIHSDASVAEAGVEMLVGDCGALPVVDDDNRIVGMVTDRDICVATSTRASRASEILVGSVASPRVFDVQPDDTLQHAMEVMRRAEVRRLPVVDDDKHVVGLLSINDLVTTATHSRKRNAAPTYDEVIHTLKAISAPWITRTVEKPVDKSVAVAELETAHGGDFDFEE